MTICTLFSDYSPLINGIVVPILSLYIIPKYLRAPVTGEYIGFKEIELIYILLGWFVISVLMIIPDYGVGREAAVRTAITTSIPFALAYIAVKLTDWAGWDKTSQIRQQ